MPPRIDAVRYPAAVRELTACIGGPRGRFAVIRARSWWSPPQMIFTTTLVFLACGFLTKAQCIQGVAGNGGVVQLNWSGQLVWASTVCVGLLHRHCAALCWRRWALSLPEHARIIRVASVGAERVDALLLPCRLASAGTAVARVGVVFHPDGCASCNHVGGVRATGHGYCRRHGW